MYTEEDYKKKCDELNLIYVDNYYRKRKKSNGRELVVRYICKKHEDKGIQEATWWHLKEYTIGCKFCAGRNKTNEDIIPLIKNKDVILISEYTGCEKPIICKCKKCGNIWTTLPKVLTTNGAGCPACGRIKIGESKAKSHEQFVEDLKKVNPDIEVIGEYKGTRHKVLLKCKIDGTEWYGYPSNLLNGSAGCPMCNISVGEKMMVDCLRGMGLKIEQQKTFKDCKNIHVLKFDAYNEEHNIIFEYNGEQHYRPVDFAGKGDEWAEQQLQINVQRDTIKKEFCKENNIHMIIVPYWEKPNMDFFILQKLKELKINI